MLNLSAHANRLLILYYNYLKIAWRSLLRYRGFALISIAGLGLGVAGCLLIFLFVRFHTSFDAFHAQADRTYRLTTESAFGDGQINYQPGVHLPLVRVLPQEVPEVTVAGVFATQGGEFAVGSAGEPRFRERGVVLVEPTFFKIFDFAWQAGDPATALRQPNTVVLTASVAQKFFGNESALGQTLILDNRLTLRVTGVMDDFPPNTNLPLRILLSYATLENLLGSRAPLDDWSFLNARSQAYVVLPPGLSAGQFEAQLAQLGQKYRSAEEAARHTNRLQSLRDIHFDERYASFAPRVRRGQVWTFATVAVFLLLMACLNFVNLAVAQALRRAREVGIRKVLGSSRSHLVAQFMGETLLIALAAVGLGLTFAYLLLPWLNDFLGLTLGFGWDDPLLVGTVLGLLAVITLLAGFYPAWLLSGFAPTLTLKAKLPTLQVGGVSVRRGLVIFQFVVTQVLLVCTAVVWQQLQYFRNAPLGFDRDAVVSVAVPDNAAARLSTLRSEWERLDGVEAVSFCFENPLSTTNYNSTFSFDESSEEAGFVVDIKFADDQYLRTYGIELVAGRNLTPSDTLRELLINETLVRRLGLPDAEAALGRRLTLADEEPLPIVGVVRDFHTTSLQMAISPCVLTTERDTYQLAGVRLRTDRAMAQVLQDLERVWSSVFPEATYRYEFLDDRIAATFATEEKTAQLLTLFAGTAIFIGGLGIYGLIAFMARQKVREVGIRKTLGASTGSIVLIFLKELARLVLIAAVVAVPISFWLMRDWLAEYPLRVSLGVGVFAVVIAASLLLSWLTVGYRAYRAATANPVRALKAD